MGFWHTGYMEFHEPVGLDWPFTPRPLSYQCPLCVLEFSTEDDLHKHRLEAHPLRRPALFIDGMEQGSRRLRITRALAINAVRTENCAEATVNGEKVSPDRIGDLLSSVRDDVCRIVLSKDGVDAKFEVEVNVASASDLKGVEQEFRTLVRNRRLDIRAVDEFIARTRPFKSAIGYCDGICNYLYGLLAKERAPDSSLPYEAYSARFSQAGEKLATYDRRFAKTVGAVIEFHFNHFRDAARLAADTRVGSVATRYVSWLEGTRPSSGGIAEGDRSMAVEQMVTDLETEKILQWSMRSSRARLANVAEMELFLKQELVEFDRVKLHVLLAETYRAAGDNDKVLAHARAVRNLTAMETWAERVIRSVREKT